jgi:hypothetical protein
MKTYQITKQGELILVSGKAKDFVKPSFHIINIDTGAFKEYTMEDLD